jgi:hypothetical protein
MRRARRLPLTELVRIGLAAICVAGHIGLIEQLEYLDVEIGADFSAAAVQHHGVIKSSASMDGPNGSDKPPPQGGGSGNGL